MSSLLERGAAGGDDHVVQFYESEADLVARAGAYLLEAVNTGAVAIVITTEARRAAFAAFLSGARVDVAAASDDGTLVWLDAADTLARFTPDGRVYREGFLDVVGGVVRAAAASGRPVRAYGDMVALLWEAGDVVGAIELETLWNELAGEVRFSLYCAYHGEAMAGRDDAPAVQRVCDLHTHVVPPLERTWEFEADEAAPEHARRLVTDVLRRAGHGGDLLDDARLVITELAANAVLHARSRFSVSVRAGESLVRILVRDGSEALPEVRDDPALTPSGRGLRLVATVAIRWGVERSPAGKVVWAELGAEGG